MSETNPEYAENFILAIGYSILCGFAGMRTISYFENTGGGRVITVFYFLIFLTSLLRALWFYIPPDDFQGSYTPPLVSAYVSENWTGFLISEILLSLGNLSVYSVFLLLGAFWQSMLNKIDNDEEESRRALVLGSSSSDPNRRGPMFFFFQLMAVFTAVVSLNIVLFVCNVYNSEWVLFYNSALFCSVPFAISIELTVFSHRLCQVLVTIGTINNHDTSLQARRILAITVVANIFFTVQVLLEGSFSVFLIYLWRTNQTIEVLSEYQLYWQIFIGLKYWSEVIVLAAELIVSTVVKQSPPNPAVNRSQESYSSL